MGEVAVGEIVPDQRRARGMGGDGVAEVLKEAGVGGARPLGLVDQRLEGADERLGRALFGALCRISAPFRIAFLLVGAGGRGGERQRAQEEEDEEPVRHGVSPVGGGAVAIGVVTTEVVAAGPMRISRPCRVPFREDARPGDSRAVKPCGPVQAVRAPAVRGGRASRRGRKRGVGVPGQCGRLPWYGGGDAGQKGAGDDGDWTRRLGRSAEDTGPARGSRRACLDPAFRRVCDRRLHASRRSIRDRLRSTTRSTSQSPTATS